MLTMILVVLAVVEAATIAAFIGQAVALGRAGQAGQARSLATYAALLLGVWQLTAGGAFAAHGQPAAALALLACGPIVLLAGLALLRHRDVVDDEPATEDRQDG